MKLTIELERSNEIKTEKEFVILMYIFQEICSPIYIIICGIHSLYFKIFNRLFWFILLSILTIVFYSAIWIVSFYYESFLNFNIPSNLKYFSDVFLVISLVKTFFYLATILITITERNSLQKEIKESPYKMVDDEFTEEMYKNIIDHSLNPMNKDVKEEFSRLTSNNREKDKNRGNQSLNTLNKSNINSESEKDQDSVNKGVLK